jgi:uncharacterized membrane protein YjjB (DUF3815 family)
MKTYLINDPTLRNFLIFLAAIGFVLMIYFRIDNLWYCGMSALAMVASLLLLWIKK